MPRKLAHITFNALAALSLLLCVGVCALWGRAAAGVPTRLPPLRLKATGDGLSFRWSQPVTPVRGPADNTAEWQEWARPFRRRNVSWHLLGARYRRLASFVMRRAGMPRDQTEFVGYESELTVPYWLPLLVTIPLPLLRANGHWRRRRGLRRARRGSCAACGYDLRATPGRCPECGTKSPTAGPPAA